MNGIFISLRDDNSFHTLIIKKSVGDYVYLVALGYEGGRTYGEFYSKLKNDENFGIIGVYSNSTGSGEWEQKLLSSKFNQNTNLFETETEELYEFMDENDSKIQNQILEEISEFVYWGYDEETEEEYDEPILKDIDLNMFRKLPNSNQFKNVNWNDSLLELTNSDLWNLSLRFN